MTRSVKTQKKAILQENFALYEQLIQILKKTFLTIVTAKKNDILFLIFYYKPWRKEMTERDSDVDPQSFHVDPDPDFSLTVNPDIEASQ